MSSAASVPRYAAARHVERIEDCDFYHTMELPGHGLVRSGWDFREGAARYLGDVDVAGKRVLDVGPASGFFSFYMESRGADVVAFERSPDAPLDVVPYARGSREHDIHADFERMANSFWFAHRALGSKVRVVTGNVYDFPGGAGEFDVAVVGSILLHLRDPFRALSQVAPHVRETIVVAEPVGIVATPFWFRLLRRTGEPKMTFLPDAASRSPLMTWWTFTPEVIARFLAVLGFERTRVVRHVQRRQDGSPHKFFTVVGSRAPAAS